MKVREQCIDRLETVTRRNEEIGIAAIRGDPAIARGRFKGAHRCRSYRDHPPAAPAGRGDLITQRRIDLAVFMVHHM